MAKVLTINISKKKGTPKYPVDEAELKPDWGIVGDAHAAPGIKQISLLAKESHDAFQPETKVCLKNGIFGENITTEGIKLVDLEVGQRFKIKDTILEVTKIGKECHAPCCIAQTAGRCIMPEEGIFAKVIKGGKIKPEDPIELV